MSVILNYTTASSDLPSFLADWQDNFGYRGDGSFNQVRNTTDQWFAGTPGNATASSVIVNGDDYSLTPGTVDGTVDTLALGSNLTYSGSADTWSQTVGLSVDLDGAPLTDAWDAAITDLSQNGSLDGLYAYFAEQGTVQNGTVGDDVLLSFGGDDVFYGGDGADTFLFTGNDGADTIKDFDADADVIDVSAWGADAFTSLSVSWINQGVQDVYNAVITYNGNGNTITVENIAFGSLDAGNVLVA
ncbi:hypothetical protein [Pleomorphomonas carboxyditropha]|nr:hypothetical protein [Pleomorphomonas carboxyditropha]